VDKSPDAYRTISEVADDLGLPQHVLRFWETRFTQIKPLKRGGGRRYYRPDDIDLVKGIKHLLYGTGFTIKGVQKILKDQGSKHVQTIGKTGQMPAPPTPSPALEQLAPVQRSEERVVPPPLVTPIQPSPPAMRAAVAGSAEDLAALIAPKMKSAARPAKRQAPQLGLFGDDESEGGVLSPQAMARMLPTAWQSGTTVSGQASAKLEAALVELEECSRLITTARLIGTGGEV
jgi:DNA-binding transcriptional MerR regulator